MKVLRVLVGIFLLIAMMAPALAQSQHGAPDQIPIELLKRGYLDCERTAMVNAIEGSGAMRCSVLYEVLKRRVFNGDFARIRDWTRRQLEVEVGS